MIDRTARPDPDTPGGGAMLSIGQLAGYVGVTVRAVRHYHQRGLLPEPARDSAGYRRYPAQAVIDLVSIKVLADAGVPLARIEELLEAPPERFARAIEEIDDRLRREAVELEHRRRRIADLGDGERLVLPPEAVAFLDELRALDVGAATIREERDAWTLMFSGDPSRAAVLLAEKRTNLADPEFAALYCAYDEAAGWDVEDPRVAELADAMARFIAARLPSEHDWPEAWDMEDPRVVSLLYAHFDESPGGRRRVDELAEQRLAELRASATEGRAPAAEDARRP